MHQFDILNDENDLRTPTNRAESIQISHPHAFVKNVLTRAQLREL